MRLQLPEREARDVFQDLIRRFCPNKRLRRSVAHRHELLDCLLKLYDTRVRAALDLALCEQRKPPLHQIQPRAMSRNEVQMEPRVPQEPAMDRGTLVSGVIIQNQMHLQRGGYGRLDMIQERPKFFRAMTAITFPDDFSCLYIQGGKESSCSVTLVIWLFSSKESTSAFSGGLM